MTFASILFKDGRPTGAVDGASEPEFFGDLNLDQITDSIVRGRNEYNLKPFFYVALADVESIGYRHEIFRDLERGEIASVIYAFATRMQAMRVELAAAAKLYYREQKQRYFLDGAQIYCAAIVDFAQDLEAAAPRSSGLTAFLEYLKAYAQGRAFLALKEEESRIRIALDQVRYSILVKGNSVTVRRYADEIDYSEDVQKTFEKFKQGNAKSHSIEMRDSPDMNHVEANVLEFVARLYPEVFTPLFAFCSGHADFVDHVVERFDREIQFYAACLEHISRLREMGLSFCYPGMSADSKDICSVDGFDLALAEKLRRENGHIVCNDFYLKGEERIIVVTGPNPFRYTEVS